MARRSWSRRRFLGMVGAGGAAGWGLAAAGARAVPGEPAPGGDCPPPGGGSGDIRLRPNIKTLSPAQVASLRAGVAAMKARPASDPTSWTFQAAIHGTFAAPTSPLFNSCEHGTAHFLAWHRGYLYFFERILRAASGDPAFMLPYWNWTLDPALPEVYRVPAGPGNSLYDGTRYINDGSTLDPSVVSDDLATALGYTTFFPFPGFSPSLESSPHGPVHVLTGQNMSLFETAALDPIFWLHHANVDRNWDVWLNAGGGRTNPSSAPFLNQPYSYADEHGATVTMKVRDMLYSSQLGYRYDDTPNPVAPTAVLVAAAEPSRAQPQVVATSGPVAGAAAATEGKPIGFAPETVALRFAPQGQAALRTAAEAARPDRPGKILVQLLGVRFATPPAFTYEVLLNLPEGDVPAEQARLHHIGTINFFQGHAPGAGHAAAAPGGTRTFDQSFDATRAVARLREAGRWKDGDVRVTLRPITVVAPEGQQDAARRRAEESAARARISYRQVDLMTVP